jgi:hypothetical protein
VVGTEGVVSGYHQSHRRIDLGEFFQDDDIIDVGIAGPFEFRRDDDPQQPHILLSTTTRIIKHIFPLSFKD